MLQYSVEADVVGVVIRCDFAIAVQWIVFIGLDSSVIFVYYSCCTLVSAL